MALTIALQRMFTGFLSLILFSALLILPLSTQAFAAKLYPVGEILHLEGEVFSVRNQNRKSLDIGAPVFMNTLIETGKDSKALIHFIDDTQIILAEETSLLVDEYVIDPYEPRENKGHFSITKGAFYWISGMISKRDEPDVIIETAKGSIGIRGTRFWAGQLDERFGVLTDEGAVSFESDKVSAYLPIDTGILFTDKDKEPPTPNGWTKETRDLAIQKVTFSNTRELKQKEMMIRRENIKKRHDFRSQLFPYKDNPFQRGYKKEQESFFTDEFEQFRRENSR